MAVGPKLAGLVLAAVLTAASAVALGPPVTPGFPNVPQVPGTVLSGLNAPQQGRTAIIAYHNGVLFTVPEVPASQPGADFIVRTWDISNPAQPVVRNTWGITPMPINAHGYFKSGPYLVLGSNWPPGGEWSFVPGPTPSSVQRTSFPGLTCAGDRGCLFGPWYIAQTYWSYNAVGGNSAIYLDWNLQSSWDHLGTTGVIGHPFLLGDLLIYASDQSRTGVATYDVGDPRNPVLLDVLTTGGPGGYWPELWGHNGKLYVVFPYQVNGNGFRVVDASDPTNLRFVADRPLPGADSMYIQFQDEFAFMGSHKVDMRTFESVVYFDPNSARPNQPGTHGIDTSQFALPLGNLLVTGGVGPNEGMAIWAHQAEPDTRGPSVGFHIPQAGRTNYPLRAPISLLIHETLESFTIVNGETFIVRPVGGAPLAGRISFAFDDVLTFAPNQPLLPDTTYEVVLPEGGIKDAAGNGMVGYSFTFSTGATLAGNAPPSVYSLTASVYPVAPGQSVTLIADADDPDDDFLEYRFDFGNGSPKSAWSSSNSIATTYVNPGHYRASVQVRDPAGSIASATHTVTVVAPPAGPAPTNSSQIVCAAAPRRVYVVNPDNGTLAALDADNLTQLFEVEVCDDPRSVAVAANQELWIACHGDDTVRVLGANGNLLQTIATGHGSAPFGVAAAPDGVTAFVSLFGAGRLLRFNTQSRQQTGAIALGSTPAAIAVSGNGGRVFVTRFISPRNRAELWEVNAATMALVRTIGIPKFGGDENADSTASGRGVANYLAGITIAPDGQSAWVASTKANTERGLLFGPDLDQDNTVRNVISQIDLVANRFARAIDIDNSDSARAVAFSPLGDYMAVALQGNDETVIFDTLALAGSNGLGSFVTRLAAGRAPQGLCTDPPTNRTFVANFMSRDVSVQETDALFRGGDIAVASSAIASAASEPLPPDVLRGKQIFYNASDPRMSAEGYISCATCHVDGGDDGRVWDFTGRGEGMRNTTTLRGRAGTGHGNVHWSANFDEIQDFENDIRNNFGGSGFLSDADFAATSHPLGPPKAGLSADLDALAAYVNSLGSHTAPRSPHRNSDGSATAAAIAGQSHFNALGCAGCHSGAEFTDSTLGTATLHDVGTIRTTSGGRLGEPLLGIDTPSLLGLWASPPYFHDGSAATIEDVFRIAGGTVIQAEAGAVSGNAWVTNQWVQFNNDDTAHGRALVNFGGPGGAVTFYNLDGGSGGTGAVEVRYSSGYGVFNLEATVNGVTQSAPLPLLGNDPAWRHTNWGMVRYEGVLFSAGSTNTVRISTPSQWANISIDHILISRPDDLAAAQPHRVALSLSSAQRADLTAYLLQIEGAPPPPAATPTPNSPPTATPSPTIVSLSIGGSVHHAGNGSSVAGAEVTIDGTQSGSSTTNANGTFTFTGLPPGTWTVRARRNDPAMAGVSALDAAWALQSAIGARTLTAAQALACDVSGNGTVSALDASYILQRLVGQMSSFPAAAACESDWILTPQPGPGAMAPVIADGQCLPGGFQYPALTESVASLRFDGAAFGDCTLNGGTAAAALSAAASGAPGITIEHPRRNQRRFQRVAVRASEVAELSALDVTLAYDGERLVLRGIRRAPGVNAIVHGGVPRRGRVRIALASGAPITGLDRPLVYAVFERRRNSDAIPHAESATVDDLVAAISATTKHPRR